jgi:hypothetical protein
VTAVLVRARDAGWGNFTTPRPANGPAVDDLAKLAEAAQRVADSADRMPKGLRANLFRALREAARAAIPPRAPAQKALAGPETADNPSRHDAPNSSRDFPQASEQLHVVAALAQDSIEISPRLRID